MLAELCSRSGAASDPRGWQRTLTVGAGKAGPVVVVAGEADARGMVGHLLSGDRPWPVIGLASAADGEGLVVDPAGVQLRLGRGPRIYVVAGRRELGVLRELLGGRLFLPAGAARVWWPGLSLHSDPRDHPLVSRADDEEDPEMLAELARSFDLSRPAVRKEIKEIEELHAMLEHELAEERRQHRDLKIERSRALQRAETAEALVAALTEQLEQLIRPADGDR
jgi:hypothetical protein